MKFPFNTVLRAYFFTYQFSKLQAMESNKQLLTTFYTAFQNKDYKAMQHCYSDQAVFNDEVFQNLDASQVRAMWEMLIKRGKDLHVEFTTISADTKTGSASWTAWYSFSQTRRKVVNRISAQFEFEDGKIIRHTDSFDFYAWSRQAMGPTGLLLGWTSFFKSKVQKTAMDSLTRYMEAG